MIDRVTEISRTWTKKDWFSWINKDITGFTKKSVIASIRWENSWYFDLVKQTYGKKINAIFIKTREYFFEILHHMKTIYFKVPKHSESLKHKEKFMKKMFTLGSIFSYSESLWYSSFAPGQFLSVGVPRRLNPIEINWYEKRGTSSRVKGKHKVCHTWRCCAVEHRRLLRRTKAFWSPFLQIYNQERTYQRQERHQWSPREVQVLCLDVWRPEAQNKCH